eukprot:TRINITY_DN1051_c0_g1_i2.p2 TRINITY_DN1051_c0_g1~~TRINITY_DN1051_c0_g1_i2.p2  ORF type:complete len:158 (-),score=41.35 TRINITY_DN1051_c0_g1_i2:306-779(-)
MQFISLTACRGAAMYAIVAMFMMEANLLRVAAATSPHAGSADAMMLQEVQQLHAQAMAKLRGTIADFTPPEAVLRTTANASSEQVATSSKNLTVASRTAEIKASSSQAATESKEMEAGAGVQKLLEAADGEMADADKVIEDSRALVVQVKSELPKTK